MSQLARTTYKVTSVELRTHRQTEERRHHERLPPGQCSSTTHPFIRPICVPDSSPGSCRLGPTPDRDWVGRAAPSLLWSAEQASGFAAVYESVSQSVARWLCLCRRILGSLPHGLPQRRHVEFARLQYIYTT